MNASNRAVAARPQAPIACSGKSLAPSTACAGPGFGALPANARKSAADKVQGQNVETAHLECCAVSSGGIEAEVSPANGRWRLSPNGVTEADILSGFAVVPSADIAQLQAAVLDLSARLAALEVKAVTP
jgi:hypothetical protein